MLHTTRPAKRELSFGSTMTFFLMSLPMLLLSRTAHFASRANVDEAWVSSSTIGLRSPFLTGRSDTPSHHNLFLLLRYFLSTRDPGLFYIALVASTTSLNTILFASRRERFRLYAIRCRTRSSTRSVRRQPAVLIDRKQHGLYYISSH